MEKILKLFGQKLFIMSIFIFSLNVSMAHTKSLDEIKLLPPDRITELAKMGNPDAQYWLGELIYNGAISNWQDLMPLMMPYWEDAMRQGHAMATYRLLEWVRGGAVPDDMAKLKSSEIKLYLSKLANAGEAKANMILFRDTLSDFVNKRNTSGETDNLLERTADKYLIRAYEIGSRDAAYRYAIMLSYGSISIPQDHSLAVTIFEEAYAMEPDEPKRDDGSLSCSILIILSDYYGGQFLVDGENYSGEADDASYLHTLSKSVKDSCPILMFRYSTYLMENGEADDYFDAYLVALDALDIAKADHLATDYMYDLLGTLALKLNEPLKAKEHFSKMKDEQYIEWLFNEYLGGGLKLCSALDVSKNECRAFIFN